MNRKELAHLWAHKAGPSGRASSFYFEGDTIYSYGRHFPIARHHKGVVLMTTRGYSNTTARHISAVRMACSHKSVFYVYRPDRYPSKADISHYKERIEQAAMAAVRARSSKNRKIHELSELVIEANSFCELFGFKTRFSLPTDWSELKKRADKMAAAEHKREQEKKRKIEVEAQEKIQKWLAGESVSIPYNIDRVYLRAVLTPNELVSQHGVAYLMETSKGARVPLGDAKRAFEFCMKMRDRGWHRNGEQFKVGNYQLDEITSTHVKAGCHRIDWEMLTSFAKSVGWLDEQGNLKQ